MISNKDGLQAQIKDYEDILKGLRAEVKTVKAQIKEVHSASTQKETTDSVELIADALLVNSIQKNLEKSILPEDQQAALDKSLSAITSITNPETVIDFPRMKQGFTQLFNDLVSGSEEKVPGTTVSFGDIKSSLESIDESVTGKVHKYEEEKVEEPKEEETEQVQASQVEAPKEEEGENWGASDGEDGDEAANQDQEDEQVTPKATPN